MNDNDMNNNSNNNTNTNTNNNSNNSSSKKNVQNRKKEKKINNNENVNVKESEMEMNIDLKQSSSSSSCIICANEKVEFYAVGPCNHQICSLCSLRLRSKSNDRHCALCKQYLEYIIVYRSSKGIKDFNSFRIDGLDCQTPDVQIDHSSSTIYYKCKDQYKDMENMRSLICPIKKCSKTLERYTTEEHLLIHLKTVHKLTLCRLCLSHRPLFVSEHKLVTETELQKHIKKFDAQGGHPLCQFCSQMFFDNNHLFTHLRNDHPICHLCPQQYQHRYYRNIEFLWDHICGSHIICEFCNSASNGNITEDLIVYGSFNSQGDYVDHLSRSHGISRTSQSTQNLLGFQYSANIQTNKFKGRNHNAAPYIDMDISPNLIPATYNRSNNRQHSNPNRPDTTDLFIIPDGMRVAGRITGTGRFRRGEEDELLQQTAEYNAVLLNARNSSNWKNVVNSSKIGSRSEDQFPQLGNSVENKQSEENKAPHPLSVMHSNKQMAEALKKADEKRKLEEQKQAEERKQLRNNRMAEALGLSESKEISLNENILLSTEMISKYANELQRPLYPPLLINYALKEKTEMTKLEKQISNMFTQKDVNSVQLKPMPSSTRHVVHCYGKYHDFNTYEYDPEPRRYISLVKKTTSILPTPISKLCSLGVYQSSPTLKELNQPLLYFSIKPHPTLFTQTPGRDLSKDWSILAPSIALLIGRIQNVLLSFGFGRNTTRIIGFKAAGANGVALEFPTLNDAGHVFYYISQEKEDVRSPRLFDLFQVDPCFNETLVLQEIGLLAPKNETELSAEESSDHQDFNIDEESNAKVATVVDKDGFIAAPTKRKGKKVKDTNLNEDQEESSIQRGKKVDESLLQIMQSRFMPWDSDDEVPTEYKNHQIENISQPMIIKSNTKIDDFQEESNTCFWTCSHCTFVNDIESTECAMCLSNNENCAW